MTSSSDVRSAERRSEGFAFYARIRLKWKTLPLDCRGIHCPVPGCGIRYLAEKGRGR